MISCTFLPPLFTALTRRLLASLFLILLGFGLRARAADSNLVSVAIAGAGYDAEGQRLFDLSWQGVGGARYRVQWRPDVEASSVWQTIEAVTPATNGTTTVRVAVNPDTATGQQGFFQVVLPEPAIFQLQPGVVSTGGGAFYIVGQCFEASNTVWIDGVMVGSVTFLNHATLQVVVGALVAGFHDVEIRVAGGATIGLLEDGLFVTGNGRSDELPPGLPPGAPLADAYIPNQSLWFTLTVATEPPTGEVFALSTDLVVPGRGPAFQWTRTYRSKAGPSTEQGEGWDFSYNIRAVQSGVDVVIHDGAGRADTFFRQGDGSFRTAEFFRQGVLSATVFTLTFADKGTWRFRAFDGSAAQGKIDRITDRNGNHLDFAYDGAGKLITIADTLARNFTVAYNGANRIASVTDFTGRAVTYGYNAAGDLTSTTTPAVTGTPTGNDFPAGKTTTLTYSSGFSDARLNHNLLTVTDPLGQLVVENVYAATLNPADFEFDRCVTEVYGGALAETVTFTYLPQTPAPANRFATTKTILNDRGNVSEVLSDSRNRPLDMREFTGGSPLAAFVTETLNRPAGQLRAGDPVFFVKSMDWNADSLPTSCTLPRGAVEVNIYECDLNPGGPARERGNLRVERSHAAPGVPSDFAELTERWSHLGGFGTGEGAPPMIGPHFDVVADGPVGPGPKASDATNDELEEIYTSNLVALPVPKPAGDARRLTEEERRRAWQAIVRWRGQAERYFDPLTDAWRRFWEELKRLKQEAEKRKDEEKYQKWRDEERRRAAEPPPTPEQIREAAEKKLRQEEAARREAEEKRRKAEEEQQQKYKDQLERMRRLREGSKAPPSPPPGGSKSALPPTAGYGFPISHTDRRGNVTTCAYDANGNMVAIAPPIAGTGHTFTYNAFGQPVTHTWPANENGSQCTDTFDYYAAGPQTGWLESEVVDSGGLGLTTFLEYNAVGVVTGVIDPRGADVQRIVNQLDQPVRIFSREAGPGIRYETDLCYDANDNLVRRDVQNKDETGALVVANPYFTTQFQFDVLNRCVRVEREVDAANTVVEERVIDANNHLLTFRSGEAVNGAQPANTECVTFDERGLPFQSTHAPGTPGQCTTQSDYDLDGNVARVSYGLELVPRVWQYQWDGASTPSWLRVWVDPMGNIGTFQHDANGNPILVRVEGEHTDAPGSAANVRMAEWRFVFDDNNRCTSQTGLLLDAAGAQTGSVTSGVTFAPNSQPASVTDERGNVTLFGYDTANRLALVTDPKTNTRGFTRDANGNVLTVTDTDKSDLGNPAQVFVMTRELDPLDRPTRAFDNVNNTTLCAYDSRGNAVLVTDPRNIQTRRSFDGLSRPTGTARDMNGAGASFADPADITTLRAYDDNSRVTAATDPNGNVTTYAYDAFDRPITTTFADTTMHAQGWNIFGDLTQTADANGTVVTNTHDALGRLIGKNITPGAGVANTTTSETFIYDGRSRLKSAANNGAFGGTTTTFTYDSLSRPLSETRGGQTTTRTFDAAGNMTSLTYPGGRVENRTFDSLNRVATIASGAAMILTNSYIGPDRPERRVHGNGTRTDYAYGGYLGAPVMPGNFAWQQVTGKFVTGPGGNLDARQFHYDRAQNKTVFIDLLTGTGTTYAYNPANWLVNTVVQQGPMTLRNTTYTFNKAGSRQNVAGTGTLDPGDYTQNATLPNPGDAQRNQYTTAPTGSLGYDENGNRVNQGAPANRAFTFDYANRLVFIVDNGQLLAEYRYNALGERVQKIVNPAAPVPVVTDFFYDGGSIIEERDPGAGSTITTTWLGTLPVLRIAPAGLNYLHTDDLDSVVLATGPAGTATERTRFQEYGFTTFFTGGGLQLPASAVGNPILFTGMHFDTESGYYFDPPQSEKSFPCSGSPRDRDGNPNSPNPRPLNSRSAGQVVNNTMPSTGQCLRSRVFDPATGAPLQHNPKGDAINPPAGNNEPVVQGNNPATIGIP